MKKIFLILTFILIPIIGISQDEVVADVGVEASVIEQINITVLQDLDFGEVAVGSTKTIDSQIDEINVGKVEVTANENTELLISHDGLSELTLTSGAATMNVSNIESSSNDVDDFGTSTNQSETSFSLSGSSQYFLYFGGEVEAETNQELGDYTGTFTLTIEYNI